MQVLEFDQEATERLFSDSVPLRPNPKYAWTILSVMPTWAVKSHGHYYLLQNFRNGELDNANVLVFEDFSEWCQAIQGLSRFSNYEDSLNQNPKRLDYGDHGENDDPSGMGIRRPVRPTPPSRSPGFAMAFPSGEHSEGTRHGQ
jgi:hypothetical protein